MITTSSADAPVVERITHEWLSGPRAAVPEAHHRMTVACPPSLDRSGLGSAALGPGCSRQAVAGWPVAWTVETWPVLIRPSTPIGRSLQVDTTRPGLLLIERGVDANGDPAVDHEVRVLSDGGFGCRRIDLIGLSIFRTSELCAEGGL